MEKHGSFLEAVVASSGLTGALGIILGELRRRFQIDRASISEIDAGQMSARLLTAQGSGCEPSDPAGRTRSPLEGTMLLRAVLERYPQICPDVAEAPNGSIPQGLVNQGMRSVVVIPVFYDETVIGTVNLASKQLSAFEPEDHRYFDEIFSGINHALAKAIAFELEKERARRFEAVSRVGKAINSNLSADDIMLALLEEMESLVPFDYGAFALAIEGAQPRIFHFKSAIMGGATSKDTALESVMSMGEPLNRYDISASRIARFPGDQPLIEIGIRGHLALPVYSAGKVTGAIELGARSPHLFSAPELEILQFIGAQIVTALAQATSFEQLSTAKQEWERTFDAIPDLITIHDRDHKIIRANAAALRALEVSEDELRGKACYELFHHGTEAHEKCAHLGALSSGSSRSLEVKELFGQPGKVHAISCSPIYDGEGNPVATVHVAKDVTEHRLLEEQLLQSEKLAAVGQLVSGIAHELNNPLAAIVGSSELLLLDSREEKRAHRAEVIRMQAERAAKIVSNLLTFARKHNPEKRCISLNTVILETTELLNYELRGAGVTIETDLAPALPCVMADFHQLQQVVFNIITNAGQAMRGQGGSRVITVRTGVESAQNGDNWVIAEIADEGPGIPEEHLSRIFDPFFTTKTVGSGTGLGLSIVYGLVESHGGRVLARNGSSGAVFTVQLPVTDEKETVCCPTPAKSSRDSLTPKRVLLVDDEAIVVDVLGEYLDLQGHETRLVNSPLEGLRILREEPIDLIIVDMKMPEMPGTEFYRRALEDRPDLHGRVVFCTGDLLSPELRSFVAETGCEMIAKPFELKEVSAVLDKICKESPC